MRHKGVGRPHSNLDHFWPMHANLTWNELEIDDSIPKINILPGVLAIFGEKSKLECTRNFWGACILSVGKNDAF